MIIRQELLDELLKEYNNPEVIESIFPKTEVQLCIVHIVLHSLKFVPYGDRKNVAFDLKNLHGNDAFFSKKTFRRLKKIMGCLSLNNISKKWTMTFQYWAKVV
jgi:putative transposase